MKVRELLEHLAALVAKDAGVADLEVWLEGCDCYGLWHGRSEITRSSDTEGPFLLLNRDSE